MFGTSTTNTTLLQLLTGVSDVFVNNLILVFSIIAALIGLMYIIALIKRWL